MIRRNPTRIELKLEDIQVRYFMFIYVEYGVNCQVLNIWPHEKLVKTLQKFNAKHS